VDCVIEGIRESIGEITLRRSFLLPAPLVLAAIPGRVQQELALTTDQSPVAIKPAPPTPDADGVYSLVPGITPPALVNAVPASYPPGAAESDRPHISVFEIAIGIDGVATSIHAIIPNPGLYEDSAIAAVKQSRFQPATLNGKPVPVLVRVRVPFFDLAAAIPRVQTHNSQFGTAPPQPRDPMTVLPGDTPPKAIHTGSPEYSEQARRLKIQGNVRVSVLVNEEGVPVDPRVEKSLGYGLDEKALEAALRYQFKPAMRDGHPDGVRIMIEENFHVRWHLRNHSIADIRLQWLFAPEPFTNCLSLREMQSLMRPSRITATTE
jgi:TonB family protein